MSTIHNQVPQIFWDKKYGEIEQDCACAGDDATPVIRWASPGSSQETDCACPDDGFSSVQLDGAIQTTSWQQVPNLYRAPLSRQHILAFDFLGTGGVIVLNEPAQRVLDAFVVPCSVDTASALLPNLGPVDVRQASECLMRLGLLRPAESVPVRLSTAPSTLTVWLHVTNVCNLNCAYCYVDRSDETMGETVGLAAVDTAFRTALRHGFRVVKLKYAGGEPTLNFSLVRRLHEHAAKWVARSGIGLREVILTNGVFLPDETLEFIACTGIRLMISLDRLGTDDGGWRCLPDGQDSSTLVAHNVDRALAQGIVPYLSITITGHDPTGVANAVAFALKRDLPFNLNFYRASGAITDKLPEVSKADLVDAVRTAFRVIEQQPPRRSLIAALVDRASFAQPHDHVCGAGRSYLVITPHGSVARCQMDMQYPLAHISDDDPLSILLSNRVGFQNVSVDDKEDCRTCVWRYGCAGGCPLLSYRATGRNDSQSPYCDVYQTLYPELLQLEGNRLLRWGASFP